MKKENKSLERLGVTSEIILECLATGGVVTTALLLKACSAFFMQGKNGWRNQSDFVRAVDLYTEKLIERGIVIKKTHGELSLSKAGKWEASRRRFYDDARKHNKMYWDKKWRLVIFDIPEAERKQRDYLRRAISGYGMYQLQQSVWVYPYTCDHFVGAIKEQVGLSGEVLYVLVEMIENQSKLEEEFGL